MKPVKLSELIEAVEFDSDEHVTKVDLKDEGTANIRTATSNAEGNFSFPDLSFGRFEISVGAPGFQTTVTPHVAVEASKTTDINITLKVGQQTETISVEGAVSPILETTSTLSSDTKQFSEAHRKSWGPWPGQRLRSTRRRCSSTAGGWRF